MHTVESILQKKVNCVRVNIFMSKFLGSSIWSRFHTLIHYQMHWTLRNNVPVLFLEKGEKQFFSKPWRNVSILFIIVFLVFINYAIIIDDLGVSIAGIVTTVVGDIKLRPTVVSMRLWTPDEEVFIFWCIFKS